MFAEVISNAMMYSKRQNEESGYVRVIYTKNDKRLSEDWKIQEEWKDWMVSVLIADSQFQKNDSLSVETLMDTWCISDEYAGEWKKRNLNHKPTDMQMKIVNDM